ncbi:MAG: LCP family protein [Clostridia bacterium]|nr:LCP family protein [Clostridia bacterium]
MSKMKNYLVGFGAFIAIFAIVAVFYLSKTGKLGNIDTNEPSNDIISREIPAFENRDSFKNVKGNFLLMCISSSITMESGDKEVYFLAIAHADAYDGQIKICPLAVKQSYIDEYNENGPYAVTKKIAKEYNIKLDKYICSNENTFALAVNNMGGFEMDIKERVEYRTPDMTLIITPGKQTLKGETFVKYLKYKKDTNLSENTKLLCTFISNCLTKENYEKGIEVYKSVQSDLLGNTNISFYDAADNIKYFRFIVENDKSKVVAVSSVEEF